MVNFKLEITGGKIDFDDALENMDLDLERFKAALERFANIQAQPFKTELWKQYNEWKRKCNE